MRSSNDFAGRVAQAVDALRDQRFGDRRVP
jgi:hypothetical protein